LFGYCRHYLREARRPGNELAKLQRPGRPRSGPACVEAETWARG
jgi:hypothetical protein